ncbi:hypothetical protein ASE27_11440 [Oerskovia sp. Root918]|uniref:hypothetical protein n=1 Tax=Oerskovia sp. Root918 TaxID=1736607 RepID=UPI0006F2D18A|nr:hypothetical protein [Oerskovia sp. Root918]KRD36222.1 hypothetical protein ASE27_11440 [Oerskovia sp. Root918]
MTDDDDFAADLRTLADEAIPVGHMSGPPTLALVKRRSRRRSARVALVSVMCGALIALGAIALPRVGIATMAPASSTQLAPGIEVPADPTTSARTGGGLVVDTRVPGWTAGTRLFVVSRLSTQDRAVNAVYEGDDADLRELRAGNTAGTLLLSSDATAASATSPDGDRQVVIGRGIPAEASVGGPPGRNERRLISWDLFPAADGTLVSSVVLPGSRLKDAAGLPLDVLSLSSVDGAIPAFGGFYSISAYRNGFGLDGCLGDCPAIFTDETSTAFPNDGPQGVARAQRLTVASAIEDAVARAELAGESRPSPWAVCVDVREELDRATGAERTDDDRLVQCILSTSDWTAHEAEIASADGTG